MQLFPEQKKPCPISAFPGHPYRLFLFFTVGEKAHQPPSLYTWLDFRGILYTAHHNPDILHNRAESSAFTPHCCPISGNPSWASSHLTLQKAESLASPYPALSHTAPTGTFHCALTLGRRQPTFEGGKEERSRLGLNPPYSLDCCHISQDPTGVWGCR